MSETVLLEEVLGLIKKEVDPALLKKAQERQSAVWEGREPDYLPLIVSAPLPERSSYPTYDLKEQFYDPEKMLYEQLWPVLGTLRAKADGVPSVRVNFGTGFLASVFGLEQEVFPDKMPWLQKHLRKEEVLRIKPEGLEPIFEKGLMPECRRYIAFYQEKIGDIPIRIYLPDTQGPFDLAHLVLGDAIFTELYDDPQFIQHLLRLTTYVYRKTSLLIKGWVGESANAGCHGGNLYMTNCGVRSCEDTTTLLAPSSIKTIVPFLQKALAPFGGWLHFCGGGKHLLEPFLALPEVKGVNFGNPEKYDWEKTLKQIVSAGKVYYGSVFRKESEPLAEYFRRVLAPLKKKGNLIFCPVLRETESPAEAIATWYQIQSALF